MPEVTAGALSAVLADGRLEQIRLAGYPALDALYVAVRDAEWQTIPGHVTSSRTAVTATGTVTQFEVRHQLAGIAFRWLGVVETAADRLRFTMDGIAESSFDANRIGFCLLHPQALKGQKVRISGPRGVQAGTFSEAISPHQPFTDVQSMSYSIGGGSGELEIGFEGDLFEVEDHRNWSDPGWKTYCTPLSAPWPVHHPAGQRIWQAVELRTSVRAYTARRPVTDGLAEISVGTEEAGAVPALGLGACCLTNTSPGARAAVRRLRPAYLHVELEDRPRWPARFSLAAEEAASLGVPLDVALVAEPDQVEEMAQRIAGAAAEFGRISVFSPVRHTTDAGTVAAARAVLGRAGRRVPVGGGSRAHFAELNRGDFDTSDWDFVTYGLTPQVHHSDDRSILATTEAVADAVSQAGTIGRGLPVVIGPITLRPRFNAAAERIDPLPPDDDGPDADPRQHTQLAAVYLAAVASQLTGSAAATAFRTTGPRGVVTPGGTPAPAARVAALLASLSGAPVRRTRTAGAVTALTASTAAGTLVLMANLAPVDMAVRLAGVKASEAVLLGAGELDPDQLTLPARSVAYVRGAAA